MSDNNTNEKKREVIKDRRYYISAGVVYGVPVGAILGFVFEQMYLGLAAGAIVGVVIGLIIDASKNKK